MTQTRRHTTWMGALLLLALLAGAGGPATAQLDASVQLDTTLLTIGDQTTLRLIVSYGPNVRVEGVDAAALDTLKAVEVLSVRQGDPYGAAGARQVQEFAYRITSFEAGRHILPSLVVRYTEAGQALRRATHPVAIQVVTLPVEGDTIQLQPIKDILAERANMEDALPWLLGLAAVLALGLLVYVLRRRARRPPPPVVVPLPPAQLAYQKAMARLRALETAQLWLQGQGKAHQSGLTDILRQYIEDRYAVNAVEMTSDEILAALRGTDMPAEWQDALRQMFQTADLVKFAKAEPPLSVHPEALQRAFALVERTKMPDWIKGMGAGE